MWGLPLMNDATVPNHASKPSAEEILYLPSHFLLFHTYSKTKIITSFFIQVLVEWKTGISRQLGLAFGHSTHLIKAF
jgi:hypothetical protein